MKLALRILAVLFIAASLLQPVRAHAQPYDASELEALLAPVALQPDAVLWQVLDAATTPGEVLEAAAWSRANPGMEGNDAVRAVQDRDWQPAVKALVAYPELLERMAESPQWLDDLGDAYAGQQADVLASVQVLRQRAQAAGHLRSDSYQSVAVVGQSIAVQPVVSHIYVTRYYDPFVVFGSWRWAHPPAHWRPWRPRAVFVRPPQIIVQRPPAVVVHQGSSRTIPQLGRAREDRRHESRDEQRHGRRDRHVEDRRDGKRLGVDPRDRGRPGYGRNGPPSPAEQQQRRQSREHVERQRGGVVIQPYRRVPESQRRPIVESYDRRPSGIRPLPR
jgi:hypothetical protein